MVFNMKFDTLVGSTYYPEWEVHFTGITIDMRTDIWPYNYIGHSIIIYLEDGRQYGGELARVGRSNILEYPLRKWSLGITINENIDPTTVNIIAIEIPDIK